MVCTWAPRGQTPVLSHLRTRDHLSVIGAVTPDGPLFLRAQEQSFDSASVIAFPGEGVWHHLKHVVLGNACCRDLPHLGKS